MKGFPVTHKARLSLYVDCEDFSYVGCVVIVFRDTPKRALWIFPDHCPGPRARTVRNGLVAASASGRASGPEEVMPERLAPSGRRERSNFKCPEASPVDRNDVLERTVILRRSTGATLGASTLRF